MWKRVPASTRTRESPCRLPEDGGGHGRRSWRSAETGVAADPGVRNTFITVAERELMLPPRSPSSWSTMPAATMSPWVIPPTGPSPSFVSQRRRSPIGSRR